MELFSDDLSRLLSLVKQSKRRLNAYISLVLCHTSFTPDVTADGIFIMLICHTKVSWGYIYLMIV